MTIEYFKSLPDYRKKEIIVDAQKVAEQEDEIATYELFRIDNFYIEVSKSIIHKFRRILNCYSLNEIPLVYTAQVYSQM